MIGMNNNNGKNYINNLGVFTAFLALGFVSAVFYSPVLSSSAGTFLNDVEVGARVANVINLSLDTTELELHTTVNSFVQDTVQVTVTTNSQYGYSLALEDADDDASLVHYYAEIDAKMESSFSGARTSSNMPDNSWGFSKNGVDFYKVPVFNSPVLVNRSLYYDSNPRTTYVDFGAKVGMTASGYYSGEVIFTAYANGTDMPIMVGPDEELSLQDFDHDDCVALADGAYTELTDTRDGKTYGIKKVGEVCWMTEDLVLDTQEILDDNNGFSMNYVTSPADFANVASPNNKALLMDDAGYYSWYTATMGGGIHTQVYRAMKSICPEGWDMPWGYDTIEESINALGSYEAFKTALNFDGTGFIDSNGQLINSKDGYYTQYWTRSAGSYNPTTVEAIAIGEQDITSRRESINYGLKVRCLSDVEHIW